jgi:hypothetical protein
LPEVVDTSVQSVPKQAVAMPSTPQQTVFYYVLGLLLGAATGYVNVRVEDLMLTAVMVTAFAMLIAFLRPDRPWRSAVLVTVLIPIGEVAAFKMTGQKLSRAGISEAILAILPANAGAYGGATLRMVIRELWPRK